MTFPLEPLGVTNGKRRPSSRVLAITTAAAMPKHGNHFLTLSKLLIYWTTPTIIRSRPGFHSESFPLCVAPGKFTVTRVPAPA